MEVFVGVDTGLQSPGVAVVSREGVLLGAVPLTIGGKVRGARRLVEIRRRLDAYVRQFGTPVGSAIEGPSLGSEHREYDLGEASGVLKLWLYEATGAEPWVIEPARLKKWATGNGGASKELVRQYVVRRTGFEIAEDDLDASDAAALALLAYSLSSQGRPQTRVQAEVQLALRAPARKKSKSRPSVKNRTVNI